MTKKTVTPLFDVFQRNKSKCIARKHFKKIYSSHTNVLKQKIH